MNGKTKLEFTMDKFSFSETRYINRLIDFAHYKTKRNRITKLFLEPNNLLSIYDQKDKDGLLFIEDGLSYNYEIEIFDQHDNKTKITIPLKGKKMDSIILPSNPKTDYLALPEEPFVYNSGIFDVYIPKGSLYGPVYLNINTTGDVLQLHKDEVALHKYMTVAADISNYEEKDKPYLYIGELNYRDEPYYSRTNRKGDRLTTRTRSFGRYGIFSDRTPPSIVPINVSEKKWMSKETHLKFKINDAQTGIESYRGTINGKFILMEYDYKTGMLIYDFSDEVITDTENKLKLLVLDKVGNKKIYETLFYRKNIN